MASNAGASFIHWALAYLLAVRYEMNILGVAIASAIHFVARFLIMYILILRDENATKCLIPLMHKDSFTGFGQTAQVGINQFLVDVMGWWAFDVFTLMASYLTKTDTAGQTILRNIGLFTFMVPVGLWSATNYLVGKYIGLNRVDLAKKISSLLVKVSLFWSISSMALVYLFSVEIMTFYTNDPDIKSVMSKAWWLICIFVFFDCI